LAVDSLKYAVKKENEIPKLIGLVFDAIQDGIKGTPHIGVYNQHMRKAKDIMKDYGLEGEYGK